MPQPVIIEGEKEWEVEKILNKRKVRGKDKYLVRWKGFTAEGDTWESKENLDNAADLVREFEEEYGRDTRCHKPLLSPSTLSLFFSFSSPFFSIYSVGNPVTPCDITRDKVTSRSHHGHGHMSHHRTCHT